MRYLILITLSIIMVACSSGDIRVTSYGPKEPTREELRKAMHYHGIFVAQQDKNHKWYFMRGGKRCPLFAYLKRPHNKQSNTSKNNS